jgi:hypothetical protein
MNIDLVTGSKMYTLGVSGVAATGASISVPLVDTQGALVACNYVDITMVADGNAAGETTFGTVELSGIGRSTMGTNGNVITNYNMAVSSSTAERFTLGKAVCGFTLAAGGVSLGSHNYSWHGRRDELVKGLTIQTKGVNSTKTADYIINYGNLVSYTDAGMPMGADRLGY